MASPNFNELPKANDFDEAIILVQYAYENGFRGSTFPDLYKWLTAQLDMTKLVNTAGLPNPFPSPGDNIITSEENQWTLLIEPGVYHQPGHDSIVVPSGKFAIVQSIGTYYNKVKFVDLPAGLDGANGKTAELFNPTKTGGYAAGDSIYYPLTGKKKTYLVISATAIGESPDTHPAKFEIVGDDSGKLDSGGYVGTASDLINRINSIEYNSFNESATTETARNTFILTTPLISDGIINKIRLKTSSNKSVNIITLNKIGDNYSVLSRTPITISSGVKYYDVNINVLKNQYIGIEGTLAIGTDLSVTNSPWAHFSSEIPSGGAPPTANVTTNQIAFSYQYKNLSSDIKYIQEDILDIQDNLLELDSDVNNLNAKLISNEQFKYEIESSSVLVQIPTARTVIRNQALTKNCVFKKARVFVGTAGILQFGIFEKPTATTVKAILYSTEIEVSLGNNIIDLPEDLIANSGQYIGVYLKTARTYVDTSKNGQLGGDRVYTSGKIEINDTQTTTGTSNYDLFSLIEELTIYDEINNSVKSEVVIGTGSKLAVDSITDNIDTPNPLFIADTFGFNQPLHPTVEYFANGFNGYNYVMVQTPYPQSANTIYKDRFECPTIHYSNDKINWTAGKLVDDLTTEEITAKSYMSDPELVWNNDTLVLELWYRITHVNARSSEGTTIGTQLLRKSINSDGTFGSREVLMTEAQMLATTAQEIRSMAILYEGGVYKMWFTGMNGGNVGYGETSTPTNPTSWVFSNVTMTGKLTNTWHLDVIKDEPNIWLIDCTSLFDLDLFKWESNIQFTRIKRLLSRTNVDKDYYGKVIYRSAPLIVDGVYSIFVSGWNNKFASIGLMEGDSFETLRHIDGGYIRQDIRVGGNMRLNNTEYVKSLIELDNRGNAIGFDYASKTLFFQREDGVKIEIVK